MGNVTTTWRQAPLSPSTQEEQAVPRWSQTLGGTVQLQVWPLHLCQSHGHEVQERSSLSIYDLSCWNCDLPLRKACKWPIWASLLASPGPKDTHVSHRKHMTDLCLWTPSSSEYVLCPRVRAREEQLREETGRRACAWDVDCALTTLSHLNPGFDIFRWPCWVWLVTAGIKPPPWTVHLGLCFSLAQCGDKEEVSDCPPLTGEPRSRLPMSSQCLSRS